jgi:hypothetical protein
MCGWLFWFIFVAVIFWCALAAQFFFGENQQSKNLSTEIGLTVLDTVEVFIHDFMAALQVSTSGNELMDSV